MTLTMSPARASLGPLSPYRRQAARMAGALLIGVTLTTGAHAQAPPTRPPGQTQQAAGVTTLPARARLVSATLYRDQAQLTYQGTGQAPGPGEYEFVLSPLPEGFDPASLEVSARGPREAGAVLVSARAETAYLEPSEYPARVKALTDSVEELREDLAVWALQQQVFDREAELMLANRDLGGKERAPTVAEWQQAADFFRARMMEIGAKRRSLEARQRRGKEQLARLEAELAQQSARYRQPLAQVILTVRTAGRGALTLEAQVLSRAAYWTPMYELRASQSNSQIELTLQGQVHQRTGSDWQGVALRMSSGQPALGAQMPELPRLTVGIEQPRPQPRPYAARALKREAANAEGAAPPPELAQMSMADATLEAAPPAVDIEAGGLTMLYQLAAPVSIPSSERPQLVELRRQTFEAVQRLATTPALDPDVFVTATVREWGQAGLISAPARVFYEGVFSGQIQVPASQTADSLVLSLGRDRQVTTSREAVQSRDSRSLLGGTLRQSFVYLTTVRNDRPTAATIRIYDRIPVSRSQDVTVETDELSGARLEPETGRLYWEVTLPPGKSERRRLAYTVRYPRGKVITYDQLF